MSNPTYSDPQLLDASMRGNQQAFAQLVERYKSLVCAVIYSKVGDLGRSEDLAQETFVVAWRNLRKLRDNAKLRPWLCGIAHNLALEGMRQRAHDVNGSARPLDAARETPSSSPTPRDHAISHEQEAVLWDTLRRLPANYRLPLILYYREGHSARQVAEATGLSEEAVRQRLARGRGMLRDRLAAFVDEALGKTRPGRSFTVGVLRALPPLARVAGTPTAAPIAGKAFRIASKVISAKGAAALVYAAAVVGVGTALYARWQTSDEPAGNQQTLATAQVESRDSLAATPEAEVAENGAAHRELPAAPKAEPALAAHQSTAADADDGDTAAAPKTYRKPPAQHPLDTEGVQIAARIIEEGWRTEPMGAARSMCLKAWAFLAKLGDDQSRERLYEMVKRPYDENRWHDDRSHGANHRLFYTLGDRRGVDFLRKVVEDPDAPFDKRVAVVTLMAWTHEQLWGGSYPAAAVDVATTYCESGKHACFKLLMCFLGRAGAERARPLAEHLLLANAYDTSGHARARGVSIGRGGYAKAIAGAAASGAPVRCVASWSLDILGKVGSRKSRDVLHEFIQTTDWEGLKPRTAAILSRIGDEDFALDYLEDGYWAADNISDVLSYACGLVKAGQKEYLPAIYSAMDDPDQSIRVRTYAQLCRLGDDAFIPKAARDLRNNRGPAGHAEIVRADEERTDEEGARSRPDHPPSDLLCDYFVALAGNTESPKAAAGGFIGLTAATKDQLQRILPQCLDALDQTPVSLPQEGPDDRQLYPVWALQMRKLVCLLVGAEDAETRQRVVDKLHELYRRGGKFKENITLALGWTGARGKPAQPFLIDVMNTTAKKSERLMAAVNYLAIEADETIW